MRDIQPDDDEDEDYSWDDYDDVDYEYWESIQPNEAARRMVRWRKRFGKHKECVKQCVSQTEAWGREADSAMFSCATCAKSLCWRCSKAPVDYAGQECATCAKTPEPYPWDEIDDQLEQYVEDLAEREARGRPHNAPLADAAAVRDRYADRVNPAPKTSEMKPWWDLAALVACQVCLAEPGHACSGSLTEEVEPGRFLCSERVDQVPVPTAPECERCHGSCVDTPDGWTRHCYNHIPKDEKAAVDQERMQVGYGKNAKRRLRDDVGSSIEHSCVLCGAAPDEECVTPSGWAPPLPHIERVDAAQRLRRAQWAAANPD